MPSARTVPAVVESHRSTLFFYRDRVVKIRRPLAFGPADYRSLERRRTSCDREVALNRALSPDVYLGTATVELDGSPVEHAVVMRRLPGERSLAAMVRSGRPVDAELDRIATVLARFHAGASRSPRIDAAATGTALWHRWQSVEEELDRFVGPVIDGGRYRELTAAARRFVGGRGPLFRRRIAEGAVCDGHGNLEAGGVFCLDDGPRILDRVEFDEERRYGDVLADLAALVQDLEVLGGRPEADALLGAYRRSSGREQPASLLHFYVACRAHARLLVECLRQEQGMDMTAAPERLVDQARSHLQAALPRVVLVGGLPGSGKSTVAAWLGTQLGAEVLSIRPGPRQADGQEGHPAGERRRDTAYRALCDRAAAYLATGRSVVLEATWAHAGDRRIAEDVARQSTAPLVAVRCQCPREERAARLAAGWPGGPGPAAPSGPELVEEQWPEALIVDTSSSARTAALAEAQGRRARTG